MHEPEILGTGQGPIQDVPIARGQQITLNTKAREWTQGRIFYVSELRRWGLICWAEVDGGEAGYRATWDEIQEVL